MSNSTATVDDAEPLGDLLKSIIASAIEEAQSHQSEWFVTVKEVARMLKISTRSVRRRWYDGTIPPPQRFGRCIRWRRLDIENLNGAYNG